ncbi:MAG: membrane protein FxsA [Candidatus Omnitrophica bacterium]|nr:membrane protein FxsA [Candidatus Omnitrophota bacterium]
MFPYLLLLFTVVPAVELMILIEVGSHIGSLNTILLILLTGVLGASLARLQGFIVVRKIQTSLNGGNLPSGELLDGLMILVGGITLLTPGFVTDTLGFLLLIPFTRNLIKGLVRHKMEDMLRKGQIVQFRGRGQGGKSGYDDIDIG